MPVQGRKLKPPDQRRNRQEPRHEWREYPAVPYAGGPDLPPIARVRRRRVTAPDPPRPLGPVGLDIWRGLYGDAASEAERRRLLLIAEAHDERQALRLRVLRDQAPDERQALRVLDAQVTSALNGWCQQHGVGRLAGWPPETRRWWDAVRSLPHAVDWTDGDWSFAIDTARIHAGLMLGEHRLAAELRTRERVIGTTGDFRRDLRIRYVEPAGEPDGEPSSVTAMALYRKVLGDT